MLLVILVSWSKLLNSIESDNRIISNTINQGTPRGKERPGGGTPFEQRKYAKVRIIYIAASH